MKKFYCKLIKLTGGGVMFRLRSLFHKKFESEHVVGQVTLLCYHMEFLSDVISNSYEKIWIYNEYGTKLINLKNVFYKMLEKLRVCLIFYIFCMIL